jgi:hypothetical protein
MGGGGASISVYLNTTLRKTSFLPQAAEKIAIYWRSHHYALVKGKYSSPKR